MALDVGTLYATLTIRDDGFQSGMSRAEATAQRTDRTIQGATRSTTALGTAGATAGRQVAGGATAATAGANTLTAALGKARAAAGMLGIAFTAKAAVSFFTDAVQNSRALGAQTNQLNVLFGKNKQEIMDWGKTASKELFISQRAAQDAAIQFATFGTVAGKSGKNLATFSKDMTKLAVETASFGGTDVQSVIDAMGSAFQGQAIPMRKYGVLLSDTMLREVALKNGIIETNRVLSGSEKVQATEIALKEQLLAVNGDIERSNGQLGQNLKGLKARYEETSAAIGDKLKPIVNSFVQLLSGPGLNSLKSTASVIGVLASGVMTLASAFGGLPGPIQALVAGMVLAKIGAGALGSMFNTMKGHVVGAATGFGNAARGIVTASGGIANAGRYGTITMGRFGSSISALGQHVPGVYRMQDAFMSARVSADRFARTQGTFAAATAGMKAGVSGLTSALGGPFSIAIIAATLMVGDYMKKQAEAKQRAKEFSTATDGIAEALEKTGGTYSAAGEQAAQAALDTIKMADGTTTLREALDNAGVSTKDAARGLAGVGDAASKTRRELEDLADTEFSFNKGFFDSDLSDIFSWEKIKSSWTPGGLTDPWFEDNDAKQGLDKLDEINKAVVEKRAKIISSLDSGEMGEAFKINADTHELDVMTDAMETFADATSGASDKVGALSKALDSLNADDLSMENATQQLHDAVRDLPDEFKTAREEANKAGREFLTASGTVDTYTKAGSKLHDTMQDTASGFGAVAAGLYEAEFANGNYAGALDVTRQKLQEQYNAHVDEAVAAGRNREEYEALLAAYGATPEVIMSRLDIVNAQASTDLVKIFGDQVREVPDSKTVILDSITDDAKAKLEGYNFAVERLPDDKGVKVTAETSEAEGLLTNLGGVVKGMPETKNVNVEVAGAETVIGQLERVNVLVRDDNGKDIVVTDNAEESLQRLQDLNVRTTTLDDGSIWILDNASEVAAKIDRELNGKTTRGTHTVDVVTTGGNLNGSITMGHNANGSITLGRYANGGISRMPSAAEIMSPRPNYIMAAEPETMGEAFIPLAPSKRSRSEQILAQTANKFGMSLMRGDVEAFAEGGFGGNHGSMPETAAVTLSAKKGINARGAAGAGVAGVGHMVASLLGGNGFDTGATSIPGMDDWELDKKLRRQLEAWAGIQSTEHQLSEDELRKLDRDIEDGESSLRGARIDVQKANDALHEAKTADKPDDYTIRNAQIAVEESEAKLREVERENIKLAARKAKAGDTAKADDLPEFKDWLSEQIHGPKPMSEVDRESLRESVESGVSAEERAMFAVRKAEIALEKANQPPKDEKDKGRTEAEKADALESYETAKRALARVQEDNARLASKYAGNVAATSGGSGGSSPSGGGLSGEQQSIVNSLGSVAQGNPGATYQIIVGQVNHGPVSVNDPQKLLETPNSTGDPIHEAMMRLGVK